MSKQIEHFNIQIAFYMQVKEGFKKNFNPCIKDPGDKEHINMLSGIAGFILPNLWAFIAN